MANPIDSMPRGLRWALGAVLVVAGVALMYIGDSMTESDLYRDPGAIPGAAVAAVGVVIVKRPWRRERV